MLAPGQVRDLVERMLKSSGRRLDLSSPFVDALLPGRPRLHVVSRTSPGSTWRSTSASSWSPPTAWTTWSSSAPSPPHAARFLEAAVVAGLNIIVAGGTQAGKTTLLNCLATRSRRGERVVTSEEVFELRFPHLPDGSRCRPGSPDLEGTGEIRLRDLVKEACGCGRAGSSSARSATRNPSTC